MNFKQEYLIIYYYYILQLGFHPVAEVLTLVHTIQMENYKTVHTVSTSTHIRTVFRNRCAVTRCKV
jgi:hypothetical protein